MVRKKYESTALICSDYDDGVYEQWYKNYKEKKGKTNGTEKYKAGESGWDM